MLCRRLLSWAALGACARRQRRTRRRRSTPRLSWHVRLSRELGPVLRFAPTRADSNRFNPLFEVRKGANEVRDVQNIVEIVDPAGEARSEDFWNSASKIVLTGVVLHVLYAEPLERKTLAVVREKLRDLDRTGEEMRIDAASAQPDNQPARSPSRSAARGEVLSRRRRAAPFRHQGDRRILLRHLRRPDRCGENRTLRLPHRRSDVRRRPVTLFLQPPPSDAPRLMPLMRLVINQAARSLMEDQTHDARGREKKHRLLLLLDEFPQLGRFRFFETMMGAMAGYGLKAYLVCQSLNHITQGLRARQRHPRQLLTSLRSFAAADPETAKRIADMAGEVWEVRPQESEQRPRALLGPQQGIDHVSRRTPPADAASRRARSAARRTAHLRRRHEAAPRQETSVRHRNSIFAKRLRPQRRVAASFPQSDDWVECRAAWQIAECAEDRERAQVRRAVRVPHAHTRRTLYCRASPICSRQLRAPRPYRRHPRPRIKRG